MPEGLGCNGAEATRADKWLCFARFFKTRSLARTMIEGRGLRINRQPSTKPDARVRPGDQLTFPQGARVRSVEVLALPQRRLSPREVAHYYRDLDLGREKPD